MKKILIITLVGMLILAFVSACASAPKPKPITCDQMITFDVTKPSPHWIGTLTGCELEGTVEYWGLPQTNKEGQTEHFYERFKITIKAGGVIRGLDNGDWDLSTFKFAADGLVNDATGDLAYLKGDKFHEAGTTSPYPIPAGKMTITGPSTMSLTAP